MMLMQDNTNPFGESKITSHSYSCVADRRNQWRTSLTDAKNKKNETRLVSSKPACVSKRTRSLPADLQNTNIPTKSLFWFLPRDHKKQRRLHPRCDATCPKVRENVDLESDARSPSNQTTTNTPTRIVEWDVYDDDKESSLLGLEFLECRSETENEGRKD